MMTPGKWRKPGRSTGNGGQCVEMCADAGLFLLRDSKMGDESPVVKLGPSDFTALLDSLKLSTACCSGPP